MRRLEHQEGRSADHRHSPGSPGFRRLNLAMCMVALAAYGVLYAPQPLLPQLSAAFEVDPATASLTASAATGALTVCVIPVTVLGARVGTVQVIRWGLLAAVLLTLLSALAPTFAVLVLLRALTGAALAGVVVMAMGYVASEVQPHGLATAMGLFVAGNSLGGVSGRLVTSGLVDLLAWRGAVAGLAVFALAAVVLAWRLIPHPVSTFSAGRPPPRPLGASFRGLLSDPAVVAVLVIPFVLVGALVAVFNYMPYRLVGAPFSLPPALVGLLFLAYLSGSLASAAAGSLATRVGRAPVLVGAIVLMALGLLLTLPDVLSLVAVGVLLFTGGFFAAHAVASGWTPLVGALAPAQANSLYLGCFYAGSSVLGTSTGLAWQTAGWTGVVAAVGGLILVGLLATTYVGVVRRRGPGRTLMRSAH